MQTQANNPPAGYDLSWKEALEQYFQPFLALCFPQVHALIEWSRPPESLDKELEQIAREAESGKRIADKLFKVWLRDGYEVWILIHIEVQSKRETGFPQRIYQYNYRAFDLYERPVISLAVLGDDQESWRPNSFGYAFGGCELSLKFPTIKLLDYNHQWQQLEASRNPFAVMIMAHLKTKATQGQPQQRQHWKWELIRGLFERGYDKEDIRQLFRLLDWMMTLPDELQNRFEEQVNRYQEDRKVPLLSHMELRAQKAGIEVGSLQTARESVLDNLDVRFGAVPAELADAVAKIEDLEWLKQLHRRSVVVESVETFQGLLAEGEQWQETETEKG